VTGPRSEADVEQGPDREQRELDALQQAQGTGKLVQDELRGKGDGQDQRDGVETERVER
jgi:hypothetical protein